MSSSSLKYPGRVDLTNCAAEPIHIIGHTQAHGILLACDPVSLMIMQAGENTAKFFGFSADELLGKSLSILVGEEQLQQTDFKKISVPHEVQVNGSRFLVLTHLSGSSLLLEFEPLNEVQDTFFFQKQLTGILNRFQEARSLEELSHAATILTREMFGYDRVMVYRFDEEWNGEVIAESRNENMDSWLGLHYPATDIPEQSRQLFLKHRIRIITDVHYEPVPLKPELSPLTGEPLDLSRSGLRAVSPIHIEYLKNMGVGASLTAAIVVKGKLWGLIACHNNSKKYLDFYQRESCRFLAQMFSTEVTLHETSSLLEKSEHTESIRRQLVVQMNYDEDILTALAADTVKFTDLIDCGGGAIFHMGHWKLVGNTPTEEQLEKLLINYIKEQPKSLFMTRNLPALFAEAEEYKEEASGLLSLKVSENKYIFWFKPEVFQVVTWGGNPQHKPLYNEKEQRLSPRKSFEKWSEKLTGVAEPWHDLDRNNARTLRENISHVLLARQRREIEALNEKLLEANRELELFSYGLSHDLRAPVRGIEGFIDILMEDYGSKLGEEGSELLEKSRGLTEKMNALIDDILEYSRIGHIRELQKRKIDTHLLIEEVLQLYNLKVNYTRTTVRVEPNLPQIKGDRKMLFQLWSNLVNNALKYSSKKEDPVVEIGATNMDGKTTYFIRDNGIGVEPQFKEQIFEAFYRAVGSKFKGTGIGLAIVKRIVEKHGGKVWVESAQGEGSVFYFYI